jgi:hypothetical protein
MFTAPSRSFLDWKNALTSIGIKESHVTEEFVGVLTAHEFTPSTLYSDTFQNYWEGTTEDEAGIKVAKDFSSLNALQEFLEPAIDWVAAWHNLKINERYYLIKTNEPDTWALFMPE